MGIVPEREYFPTVAIESGWSQRLTRLNHDIVVAQYAVAGGRSV